MEETMTGKKSLCALLGASFFLLIAASACNLNLATNTVATPQIVVVTATGQTGNGGSQDQATPTNEPLPSFTPTPTLTPTITPTATIALPTMAAGQDLSCVKGPHWILYEWVTKISKGETVTLTARSPAEWPDYFYVRKSDGTECWAFGGSSTVTGDTSTLPVREAPPLPEVDYTITNKTGLAVVGIRIREMNSSDWGANRLSAALAPGATFSLTLTAGYYDVLVQDSAAGTLYEKNDWPIGSEPTYRNIALDAEFEFYLQNNMGFDLCTFSVRPAGGSWKVIHAAADGAIATGSKLTFKLLPAMYSLRVNRCTGPLVVDVASIYFGPAVPGYTLF
jgi:hypothetical protein